MKRKLTLTGAFLAALVVLTVAGTKISRLTQTTTIQGDSLFVVVTGATDKATRAIEATNLISALTNLPNWPSSGSGSANLQTNANQFGATNVLTIKNGAQFSNITVRAGLTMPDITDGRVVVTDDQAALTNSAVTSTELGYLSGVSSAIQTQFASVSNYVDRHLGVIHVAPGWGLTEAFRTATNGSTFLLGIGTHSVTSSIVMANFLGGTNPTCATLFNKTNITILGYPGQSIVDGSTIAGTLIWATNCANIEFSGVTFRGYTNHNPTALPIVTGNVWGGVEIYNCERMTWENCRWERHADHGLVDDGSWGSPMDINSTNQIRVVNCTFDDVGGWRTNAADGACIVLTGWTVENCHIQNSLRGFEPYVEEGGGIVNNAVIRNNTGRNIVDFFVGTAGSTNIHNALVANNRFDNDVTFSHHGTNWGTTFSHIGTMIHVNGGRGWMIRGNQLRGGAMYGILIGGNAVPVDDITVDGNYVANINDGANLGVGIYAGTATDTAAASASVRRLRLANNVVTRSSTLAYAIDSGRDVVVENNTAIDPTLWPTDDVTYSAFRFGRNTFSNNRTTNLVVFGNHVVDSTATAVYSFAYNLSVTNAVASHNTSKGGGFVMPDGVTNKIGALLTRPYSAGSNITLTDSGNTTAIASTGGAGGSNFVVSSHGTIHVTNNIVFGSGSTFAAEASGGFFQLQNPVSGASAFTVTEADDSVTVGSAGATPLVSVPTLLFASSNDVAGETRTGSLTVTNTATMLTNAVINGTNTMLQARLTGPATNSILRTGSGGQIVPVTIGANLTLSAAGELSASAGSGGGTNFPPAIPLVAAPPSVSLGSGVRQFVTVVTNASFALNFTGTSLNGETIRVGVSNHSASTIYMTNHASGSVADCFDPYVASNVTVFPVVATSIRFFDFVWHTNFNLGTVRQELQWSSELQPSLAVASAGANGFLALLTNAAGSIVTVSNSYLPQSSSMVLSNVVGLASTVFTNVPLGGTNISVRTTGGTNFIDTTGELNNWAALTTNVWNSRQGGNAVLTNLIGTVANNVTNENSAALQIDSGTLTLTPGNLSNIVATATLTNMVGISYDYGLIYSETNGAGTNITVNFAPNATNHIDIYTTNTLSQFTNISGLATGNLANKVIRITPSAPGQNLTMTWPSGAQHGIYKWLTNANSTFWTTLTNGKTYVVSMTAYGTNIHPTLTLWE